MLGIAFRAENDNNNGFKFIPVDLTGCDFLKYMEDDTEEDLKDRNITITTPCKPTFKELHQKSRGRTVMRGVKG